MALERELKFSVTEGYQPSLPEVVEALRGTPFTAESLPFQHVRDSYHDDERGTLRRAGLALRRRRVGSDTVATLKTQGSAAGGLHERDELELEVPGTGWPAEIRARLAGIAEPEALAPRAEVVTGRARFRILERGAPVATVSFDDVEASRPDGDARVGFHEVEIEAEEGVGAEVLWAVARALEPLALLVPSAATKLERAEALLAVLEG